MSNLAIEFLEEVGESLSDYEGMCGELVDALIHRLGEERVKILYIKPQNELDAIENGIDSWGWKYHMVAVIDGMVHDAWFPNFVLPPKGYMRCAFPNQRLHYEVMT